MKKIILKKTIAGALSVIVLSLYGMSIHVDAADHVHTYTTYDIQQVYENSERNCVYDKSCVITTKGYIVTEICSGCGVKKQRTETTTSHSVRH